jgi:hypothetical protein
MGVALRGGQPARQGRVSPLRPFGISSRALLVSREEESMSTLISVVALIAVIYALNNHRKELHIH